MTAKPRTAQDFLNDLESKNVTVAQWCRDNKFSTSIVWAVISGAVVGRSGESRRAMQSMGLPLPSARRNRPAQQEGRAAPTAPRAASAKRLTQASAANR
jgi:gp16 family phage-associated protein